MTSARPYGVPTAHNTLRYSPCPPNLLVPSPETYFAAFGPSADATSPLPIPTSTGAANASQRPSSSPWGWSRSEERGLTSDAGWGCMLRTGQSLLANALIHLHLGRGERNALLVRPISLTHHFRLAHPAFETLSGCPRSRSAIRAQKLCCICPLAVLVPRRPIASLPVLCPSDGSHRQRIGQRGGRVVRTKYRGWRFEVS